MSDAGKPRIGAVAAILLIAALVAGCTGSTGTAPETSASPSPAAENVPFFYGDDPAMDALWKRCAAGSQKACRQLAQRGVDGSDYQQYGATCGGRTVGGGCGGERYVADWGAEAEAVCRKVNANKGAPPSSVSGSQDADRALYLAWHATVLADAATRLRAIGAMSASEADLVGAIDLSGQLEGSAAQLYLADPVDLEQLNAVLGQRDILVSAALQRAGRVGAPSCAALFQ